MSHKDSTRYLLKMENQYQAQDIKERCIMRNADPLARTQPHILPSSISVYIYIAFDMLSKSYSDISMCMCEMCLVYWGWTIKLNTHKYAIQIRIQIPANAYTRTHSTNNIVWIEW